MIASQDVGPGDLSDAIEALWVLSNEREVDIIRNRTVGNSPLYALLVFRANQNPEFAQLSQ
jgi:hypothetical protein